MRSPFVEVEADVVFAVGLWSHVSTSVGYQLARSSMSKLFAVGSPVEFTTGAADVFT